jgi:hypothetical protein
VDSDRLLYDYEKLQRKGKDLEDVEPLRLQSEGMQLYYERLNNELKRGNKNKTLCVFRLLIFFSQQKDIPILIDDRALFYTPLFANWIFHIHEYYRIAQGNLAPLLETIRGVDLSQLHMHPQVITSEEASYYNVEIKDATPDDMDAPPMSTQAGEGGYEEGGAPPQQYDTSFYGNQQPPPSQNPAMYNNAPPQATGYPQARTLYAFQGQDQSELTFAEGEIISVYAQNGEWWEGEIPGKGRGLFPANYVQLI